MSVRNELAAAARQLVGVDFRLLGRDPQQGLDCVGVLVVSLAAIDRVPRVPLHYRLRRTEIDEFIAAARLLGLTNADGQALAGDVLVARPGPAQFHAAIVTADGIVHAHAGLGQVVLSPAPLTWPLAHHWRLSDQ